MKYRELLEYVKNNPTCFWDRKQRSNQTQYRYSLWVEQQNREYKAQKEYQRTLEKKV